MSDSASRHFTRLRVLLFPWPALRRLRLLVEQPPLPPSRKDEFEHGYDRAMWEVGLNIGVERR